MGPRAGSLGQLVSGGASSAGAAASRATAGRDIAGQIVLRALNLALGVGVTLLLVRTLGTDGFGRWSVLLAVIGFVSYFGSLGLAQVAVERAAADPDPGRPLVRGARHAQARPDRAGDAALARRLPADRRRRGDAGRRRLRLRDPAARRPQLAERRLPAPGPERRGDRDRGRQRHPVGGRGRGDRPARRRPGGDGGGLPRRRHDHQHRLRRARPARVAGPLQAARARSGRTCCARACPSASAACSRSATATSTR